MDILSKCIKSVLDQDNTPIVLCDLEHTIIYMNAVAIENYSKDGGAALLGKSLLNCHPEPANAMIKKVVAWFAASKDNNRVHTFYNKRQNKDVYMIALRDESGELIGYYEKHEFRNVDTTPMYEMK